MYAVADLTLCCRYVMSLEDKERKANGDRILVESLKEFRNNFGIFSEGSLLNLGMYY